MANCLTHISVHCPGLRQATFVSVELMYVGSQQPVEKGSQALGGCLRGNFSQELELFLPELTFIVSWTSTA